MFRLFRLLRWQKPLLPESQLLKTTTLSLALAYAMLSLPGHVMARAAPLLRQLYAQCAIEKEERMEAALQRFHNAPLGSEERLSIFAPGFYTRQEKLFALCMEAKGAALISEACLDYTAVQCYEMPATEGGR